MSRRLTLQAKNSEILLLSGLDDFLTELLLKLPEAGAPHPDSDSRLFPSLSGGTEPEMDDEWREFVRPELEAQFEGNRDRVEEDLTALRASGGNEMELEIPQLHVGAWIHALNQARLSLVARHRIKDEVLEEGPLLPGLEGMILFQIQFYGVLQEWLIEAGQSI